MQRGAAAKSHRENRACLPECVTSATARLQEVGEMMRRLDPWVGEAF